MTSTHRPIHFLYFIIGFLVIIGVFYFDQINPERTFLEEDMPRLDMRYLLRSILILISIFLIILGFSGNVNPEFQIFTKKNRRIKFRLLNYLLTPRNSVIIVVGVSIVFVLLAFVWNILFHWMSYEDNILEWLSAISLFLSSFFLVFAIYSIRNIKVGVLEYSILIMLSFMFFLIGMEEVSWFQRVIGFETPMNFSSNAQEEFNFHNFSTSLVENLYYLGSFLFLIVIPFYALLFPKYLIRYGIIHFVPQTYIVLIASVAFAYNYDMWNISLTQITFYGSILILIYLSKFSKSTKEQNLIGILVLILIIEQIVFLLNPDLLADRIWTLTEYKEFFIPIGFLFYSLDIYEHYLGLKIKTEIIK